MVATLEQARADCWTPRQMAAIDRMLNPRSIAVIGATPRQQYGGRFLRAALYSKDRVLVYPVNPNYRELSGVRCYASVEDLPETPDLAGVVVPASQVLGVLKACHRKGVASAIVISAGFAERGTAEGRALQMQLTRFAQDTGLRISGPNCLGVANLKDDIWPMASGLTTAATPTQPGAVGLVCQSGATAFGPLQSRAAELGIGYTYIISTGNEADLDFTDYARYLLDDSSTKVIAGFIEGLKSAEKFVTLAKLAAERGKPIVLIKIGRSEAGSRAAISHTGGLTGSDTRFDAICTQFGVTRVQDYDDLLEVANLMAHAKKSGPPGIAVVSHSGGVSSLTADMLGAAGLQLPSLTEHVQDELNRIIKGFGWASNPADLTGYLMREDFPRIVQAMIDQPDIGTLVIASAGSDARAKEAIALRNQTEKNLVYCWTGARGETRALPTLKAAGVPVFYTPTTLAKGLKSLYSYHAWRDCRLRTGFATTPELNIEQRAALNRLQDTGQTTFSEFESKQLLSAWGIRGAREVRAASADQAVAAAEQLGYPVVLKADSAEIAHKTEAGVVRLRLGDAAAVRNAYADILACAATSTPGAALHGVLVEEMVTNGVEVIIGVTQDQLLGPMLLFGSGGVLVEVYQDVAARRCPIGEDEARGMIAEVRGARLLRGFRGRLPADIDALAEALVAVSHMAVQLEDQLAELDINPLMVLPEGEGVKAADALVVLKGAGAWSASE